MSVLFDTYFSDEFVNSVIESKNTFMAKINDPESSNFYKRTYEASRGIYPTNFHVLEFVLNNLTEFENKRWLDYGCGLGLLLTFLNKLKIECYGYDNWSQGISKENAIEFQNLHNAGTIIEHSQIIEHNFYALSSMGIWCSDINYYKCSNLTYIFEDKKYRTSNNPPPFFKIIEENEFINI